MSPRHPLTSQAPRPRGVRNAGHLDPCGPTGGEGLVVRQYRRQYGRPADREIVKFVREFGEPRRNRTYNPQIKSLIGYAKTFEILRILHARSAKYGTARPIDGTQTAPQAA